MSIGQMGEGLVAERYAQMGYRVIARNVRLHLQKQVGEIDLIAVRDHPSREIVFVEVKTRTSTAFGQPAEAVDWRKRHRLMRAVRLYLMRHPQFDSCQPRIDVAAVRLPKLPLQGFESGVVDKSRASVTIFSNVIEDD